MTAKCNKSCKHTPLKKEKKNRKTREKMTEMMKSQRPDQQTTLK